MLVVLTTEESPWTSNITHWMNDDEMHTFILIIISTERHPLLDIGPKIFMLWFLSCYFREFVFVYFPHWDDMYCVLERRHPIWGYRRYVRWWFPCTASLLQGWGLNFLLQSNNVSIRPYQCLVQFSYHAAAEPDPGASAQSAKCVKACSWRRACR